MKQFAFEVKIAWEKAIFKYVKFVKLAQRFSDSVVMVNNSKNSTNS